MHGNAQYIITLVFGLKGDPEKDLLFELYTKDNHLAGGHDFLQFYEHSTYRRFTF